MKNILILILSLLGADYIYAQDDQNIYTMVEIPPEFPTGYEGFYAFVSDIMRYPDAVKAQKIQGKVYIQFVVTKDGEVVDERVVQGVHELLDAEALRIMKLSPHWVPGRNTNNGPTYDVRIILPITFKILSEKELKKVEKRKKRRKKRDGNQPD